MIWQIRWSRRARADLRRLDRVVRNRVLASVRRYAETEQGDMELLHGPGREWRLRVGDWRVKVRFNRQESIMAVTRVQHRSEAYR